MSGIGQPPAGKLERWILAQMIEVVRVLIAAGDGENARAKDAVQRMGDQQWIARIGDDGGEFVRRPSRRSACPSNITPASEVMRPPSNAAVIFLRPTAGNENGRRLSSIMAGVAVMRWREGSA